MSEYHSPGKTTLSPDVLLTIARQAALEVEGVSSIAPVKGGVNSLFGHASEGVRMTVEEGNVFVDLYLVVEKDVNIREISRTIQHKVARSIAEMTGLEVGHVNIHIEDIHYLSEA
jgi:uncharacterized alkaline shock family protein YloU